MQARQSFGAELEQVHLQVEVMALRVDHNLALMRAFLVDGNRAAAAEAIAGDDEIDQMNVSLTERCYELLLREAPVAADLRFIVSVVRVLGELERIGDLSLRVVKIGPARDVILRYPATFRLLVAMCDHTIAIFRDVVAAWSSQDLALTQELVRGGGAVELVNRELASELLTMRGDGAVEAALNSLTIGKALDRIADHAVVIGYRLRYMLTGDTDHLAAEVR